MTHFLHYAPSGDFEQGIFIPYASLEEAESQAAWELLNGASPEIYAGIFEADYAVGPRPGWTRTQIEAFAAGALASPHLDPEQRRKIHDLSSLVKQAKILAPKLLEDNKRGTEEWLLEVHEALQRGEFPPKNAVPGNAYVWATGGTATATPAALSAATAKTVVYTVAASSNQHAITEIGVSFDGVTSSAVPALIELVSSTTGTAGTPRSALAAGKQERGWPAQTSQTTAADTYSAEPGTLLVNRKWFVSPNGGLFVAQFPLGREPTGLVTATTDGKGWGIRVTAPATVNCHAYMEWEE